MADPMPGGGNGGHECRLDSGWYRQEGPGPMCAVREAPFTQDTQGLSVEPRPLPHTTQHPGHVDPYPSPLVFLSSEDTAAQSPPTVLLQPPRPRVRPFVLHTALRQSL